MQFYGPLSLRASITICSLLSVKHYTKLYKKCDLTGMAVYDRKKHFYFEV